MDALRPILESPALSVLLTLVLLIIGASSVVAWGWLVEQISRVYHRPTAPRKLSK